MFFKAYSTNRVQQVILAKIYNILDRLCDNTLFLIAVAVLVLCLFVTSSYLAYQSSQDETVQNMKIDIGNQMRIVASSIEEYFQSQRASVHLIADFPLVREYLDRISLDTIKSDPDFANINSLMLSVAGADKSVTIVWLAGYREDYLISLEFISSPETGWSTRGRPWFPGTIVTEDIHFTDPYRDHQTGDVCVSLVKKIYEPDPKKQEGVPNPPEIVGFVGLDLFFPPIRKIMEGFVSDGVRYPIMISHDGSILYHPDEQLVFTGKLQDIDPVLEQFTKEMTNQEAATHLVTLERDHKPVYFGYTPIKGTDWSIGIIWDKQDAEKTLMVFEQTLMRSLLFNLLLLLIPIVFFGWVIARRSRRFATMKRLYDVVVDQMQTGIAVVDPNTDTFLLINPAYEYFFGISRENLLPFSAYHSSLGLNDTNGLSQETSIYHTIQNLSSDNLSETTEVILRQGNTERCYTHFLAGFHDYVGRKLLLSVLTDITELKRMQETLRSARDVAESASQAKSVFLANMSHEIRTPMHGIIGLIDLLATTPLDSKQREYVELVQSSAGALLTVINDVLDHSKIEAGKLLVESYTFDLWRLVRELSFAFTNIAQNKSIAFHTTVVPEVPQFVRGDANRLRQILSNFLSNATKFTERGTVNFRVTPSDDSRKPHWVRFEITDTGIGITDSQTKRLFHPFEQADSSTSRKFGGTGLGLPIAQKLTQLMGGETGCQSQYGVGSTFWCELPLPVSSEIQTQDEHDTNVSESKPMHILLVDDVNVNLIVLSSMLQKWGHIIETVTNGKQAIELMKQHRYDLVFMDCQMPEMDGYECTERIRVPETGVLDTQVPIIAVTAHAMTGDKERCLASGMDDYISKPIDRNELQSKLIKWTPK